MRNWYNDWYIRYNSRKKKRLKIKWLTNKEVNVKRKESTLTTSQATTNLILNRNRSSFKQNLSPNKKRIQYLNKSSKIKSTEKMFAFTKIEINNKSSSSSYDSEWDDLISKNSIPKKKQSNVNMRWEIIEEEKIN